MRAQQGHATSADGTKIFYQTVGTGRPLLCMNGLAVPLHYWQQLCAELAGEYQIVCWEYRGHGRSDPAPRPEFFSYEDNIADAIAVIEHLDLQDIIGIGHSSGFQILLDTYAARRERFAALASFVGTYGETLSHFFGTNISRNIFDLLYCTTIFYPHQVHYLGGLFTRSALPHRLGSALGIIHGDQISRERLQPYLDSVVSLDPHYFATIAQAAEQHSAEEVLSTVEIPTLLIAGEDDKFVPLSVVHHMEELLPQCELEIIPGGSHGALFEVPEFFNTRLKQFLWTHRLAPQSAVPRSPRRPRRAAQS